MDSLDELDFGELARDENFKKHIVDMAKNLSNSSNTLDVLFSSTNYDDLCLEDKIRFDLFVAFAINTFYWIYLRIKGIDPNNHEIKQQINRIKEYMLKSKKVYEKKTMMPRINQDAAKRFIRNGLWIQNSCNNADDKDANK